MIDASVLHHGTSILCLLSILHEGAMRIDLGRDEHPDGVSLSTSLEIAKIFAAQAEEFAAYSGQFPDKPGSPCAGAVLTFDRAELDRCAGLREVRWDGVGFEAELRTTGPFSIDGILAGFSVSDEDLAWYAELASDLEPHLVGILEGLPEHPLRAMSVAGPAP